MKVIDDALKQLIIKNLEDKLRGTNPTFEVELEVPMQTIRMTVGCEFQRRSYRVQQRVTIEEWSSYLQYDVLKYMIEKSINQLNAECAKQFKSYGR